MSTTAINPAALSIEDAAQLLTSVGGHVVTAEMITRDIQAGAPRNHDGSINIVHYGAWLTRTVCQPTSRRSAD